MVLLFLAISKRKNKTCDSLLWPSQDSFPKGAHLFNPTAWAERLLFFQWAFKFTYCTRNRSPHQKKKS